MFHFLNFWSLFSISLAKVKGICLLSLILCSYSVQVLSAPTITASYEGPSVTNAGYAMWAH